MSEKNNKYITALWETILILILTTLPTIFGFLSINFDNQSQINMNDLYKAGEFFLYSVSFSGSAFIVFQSSKVKKGYFSLIIILISSVSYTVLSNTNSPNLNFILYMSLTTVIFSLIIFYRAQLLSNNNISGPDIRGIRSNEANAIAKSIN